MTPVDQDRLAPFKSSRQALVPPPQPRSLPARIPPPLLRARRAVALPLLAALCLVGAASTPAEGAAYNPAPLELPAALHDIESKTMDGVTVAASILPDQLARQHFGADFARHEVQALWLRVSNGTPRTLWFIPNVVDPDFYSADEVALMLHANVPAKDRDRMRQDLRDASMRIMLAPRTVTEGFVFLPRVEGGRYVDVRLHGDSFGAAQDGTVASGERRELRFEFALTLPDGDFDYERLDLDRTYAGRELPDLAPEQLRVELERLSCCAMDASGREEGDPLNITLVGEATQVLNSLTRSGWSFTHRITLRSVQREVAAAVEGAPYAVAPVSSLYLFGRKQDLALQRARRSIAQRNHMRLWLAPFRCEGRPVWVGQVSRDIGVKVTPKSPTLTTHVIDPAVDTSREYLLHSLLAQGFVDRFGFARGSAIATADKPRFNLTGDPYLSDGMRLVVFLAPEPVTPDQTRNLSWERSAAPIAEGQSEAARRNVRPLDPEPEPAR